MKRESCTAKTLQGSEVQTKSSVIQHRDSTLLIHQNVGRFKLFHTLRAHLTKIELCLEIPRGFPEKFCGYFFLTQSKS